MKTHPENINTLRYFGYRITPQRDLVLEIVESSPEHLDAEAIYQRAKEKDPNISLATVYRTLTAFKEVGLVEQCYIGRDHAREHYEPVGAPEHHHFTCMECQKVIELQIPGLEGVIKNLQQELGIHISHACMCLEGYCQACASKRQGLQKDK